MRVLSNVEFERLTEGQNPRLRMIAKQRCDQNSSGFLTLADVATYAKVCMYSGDHRSATWLKNLAVAAKSGKISRLRSRAHTWEDHREEVHNLHAAGNVPFDIGQHVLCKDSGRYGSVADYIPASKEYLVVLDPFQIRTYKKDELQKVAHKVEKTAYSEAQELVEWTINDPNMYGRIKEYLSTVGKFSARTAQELAEEFFAEGLINMSQDEFNNIDWFRVVEDWNSQ
jgi:hypothetical protein